MTRQYIGARYVPKFFEDENGDPSWRDSIPYEALTIVMYLGNSYTSKKPVPIGVQIDNTEYWVLTGNYNAQVEALKNKVDGLKSYASFLNIPTTVDCTSELQKVIDDGEVSTLILNDGTYNFSEVNITRPINIMCENSEIMGVFVLDSNYITFHKCYFNAKSKSSGIKIKRCRFLNISECIFNSMDKAIEILPLNGKDYGSTSEKDALFHQVGCHLVDNNEFYSVNYVYYATFYEGSDDPTPLKDRRMRVNDISFSNNIVNTYKKTALHFMGCDGLFVNNNTAFIDGDHTNLKHFIYLREGFYLDVNDNRIWGSGEYAIKVEWCEVININANIFAYCGVTELGGGVFVKNHGSSGHRCLITNNTFDKCSDDAIKLEPLKLNATICNNNINPANNHIATSNNSNRVFIRCNSEQSVISGNENTLEIVRGNNNFAINGTSTVEHIKSSHTFSSSGEKFIIADLDNTFFNGLALITVSAYSEYSDKSATYLCLLSAMGSNPLPSLENINFIKTLAFTGLAVQTGSPSVESKWCNFTFELSSDKKLKAISVNSVSTYYFKVQLLGDSIFQKNA